MIGNLMKAASLAAIALIAAPATSDAATVTAVKLADALPLVVAANPSPPTSVSSFAPIAPPGTLPYYDNVSGDQFVGGVRVARDPFEDTALAGSVYSSVSRGQAATFDIPIGASAISFIWGSPDAHNTLELFNMGVSVFSITGSAVAALASAPTAVRAVVVSISDVVFDSYVKSSALNAFEFANTTTTPIPLPAAGWMLISALAGMGFISRRRKAAA